MPSTDERLASLEARMDRIDDLSAALGELRSDLNRQFAEMNRQFADVDRQFTDVRADINRDFRWLVGMQTATMVAIIGALVGAYYR